MTIRGNSYDRLKQKIEELGGQMWPVKGGGPGCVWHIRLYGKEIVIQCRNNYVNALDCMYVAKTAVPTTWQKSYIRDPPLVSDWLYRLTALMTACAP